MQPLGQEVRQSRHRRLGRLVRLDLFGHEHREEKKDITTVVVKSVTGAAGTRKEILRDVPSCQMPGAELIIQNRNGQLQQPMIEGDIVWKPPAAARHPR
ncbi:MAG: hypothetical protein ACLR4Z_01135 [Butyricicoccaceae bacterium]